MRNRKFVGISAVIGVFCTFILLIAHRKGYSKGFIKGYSEADIQNNNESIKSI